MRPALVAPPIYASGMVSTEETLPLPPLDRPRQHRRRLTVLTWLMAVPFVIWAAARVFGLESGFPTVQLIAFTPYVAVASLIPLVIAILTKRIWPAVAVAVATIALAACVLPRWIADGDPAPGDGPSLRVMSVNRQFASGFGQAQAGVQVSGAKGLHVESVHPCAPAPTRERDDCFVADLTAQPAATPDGPVNILIGDFNATLDHEAFREVLAKGYRDAADVVGAGFTASWPYDERWFIPGVTIDHVVADKRVGVRRVALHQIPGSDHKAVFAELVLPNA